MKRITSLLIAVGFLTLPACHTTQVNADLQKFAQNFSTANVHLYGHLLLFGEYKGDLSALTYDQYLPLLKQNEQVSTQGVAEIVKKSNDHYFTVDKKTFMIVIYIKKWNAVIYDDASTAFCDSIKVLNKSEPIPKLENFIRKKK